ncbi:MAG: hypothetical protein Q4D44_03315, partial [Eubacteriales bacterium]|nr:hypothetical protein [Eubacteriales bacterium]
MSAVTLVNSDVGINLNINGGYYNCDALMDGGNITVSGGVFTVSSLPSNAVVAEGKTLFDDAGGALQVFRDGVRYVCIVGDAHTCHDGKSLAPLPGGVNGELFGEFYLPADREFDGSITSPGWNTICLNGHKLKSSGSEAGTVNVTEGRLTVCDCSENEKGVLVANVKVAPKTEGKRSCTFNLQSGGIEGGIELSNGEALWSKFNMTGGRLGAVNTPVTVGQNGKAVISDGEIIGISNAVSVTSNGSAEITGGYFFNRDDGTPVFNGCNATGGYFYYKPADSDVAPGCEAMQLTTPIGIYKWRVMKVHEHPDGTKFTPLTQTSGDLAEGTYFLDKDIDLTGELNIGNNVTICLNGKTLTGGNYGIKVSNSAPVTICDCSEKQEGTITAAVQVSGGKLTLESGKIVTSDYIPGVQINSGTFDMKGGEVAAVSALGGSFNLSGGTVRYNGTGINSPIIIANSNTNITGGTVIAWRDKPVIVAKSGTVTISGGYFVTKEGTPFFEGCKATGGYFSHEPAPSDIATDYEAYDAGIEYEGRKYSHMIAPKDAHCHDGIVFAEGYRNGSSYYLTADSEIIRLTDGATYNICLGGKTVSEGIALVNNTAVNLYGCPLAQNPGSVG